MIDLSRSYVGLDEPAGLRTLSPDETAVLRPLAACLIPGDDSWPEAGESVLAYLDATATRAPGLLAELRRVAAALATEDGEDKRVRSFAARLEQEEPALFATLLGLVYEGYYRDPETERVLERRTGYAPSIALEGTEMPSFDPSLLVRVAALPGRFDGFGASDVGHPDEPWPPAPAAPPLEPSSRRGRPRRPEADVLVVGSGAAGAAVCARLGARGLDVVCLERGPWYPPEERPKAFPDWEVRDRRAWSPLVGVRAVPCDYPVRSAGADHVETMMYSGVGGSTAGYGGHFWRLSPSDFRLGSSEAFGVDWPIGYDDLAPYYTLNERVTGVSGLAGDPAGPPRAASLHPPLPIGAAGERFAAAFERLGWRWWVPDQAIVSRPHAGRPACTNRGFCRLGCPQGSLSTADLTYWPRALEAGVELRTGCAVSELVVAADGRVRGVLYDDDSGHTLEARARLVVVCANGIGTPRLLLMSRPTGHPDGLANSSGLVGRNLMLHVSAYAFARFEERLDTWQGPFGVAVASREFAETDPDSGFQRGHIVSVLRGGAPLMTAAARAPWGTGHHAALERYLGHEVGVWVCGDDAPEPDNRVELDDERRDVHGLPGARLLYRLSPNSEALAARALERVQALADAAGADELRVEYGPRPVIGWHLMGTARMGDHPSTSVVDARHRAHDVPNLFLVDGSSMPTGGCVNPTNTIQALALRAADGIWDNRRDWGAIG